MQIDRILCACDEIVEKQSKGALLTSGRKEKSIFFVAQSGKIRAYRNECPHRSVPLDWSPDQFLTTDNEYIICATHGALFNIQTGLCVSGPCIGDRLEKIPIKSGKILNFYYPHTRRSKNHLIQGDKFNFK